MKKSIVLANGKPPAKNLFTFLARKGYTHLICADGGANSARKLKLMPDIIIGDLDSITAESLRYYSGKCEIVKVDRQNDTDVEKCIKYALKKGCKDLILLGVTGNRLDHSFCNVGIVLKFYGRANIRIIHEKSVLAAASGELELPAVPGEIISIYGIESKTRINAKGLKYPLRNCSLPFGVKESTSNMATASKVSLKISGGKVLIIRDFKTMKAHGLF